MPIKVEIPAATLPNYFNPPLASDPSALVLNDHRAQSSTTINGWASVFFGLPFAAIGVFIATRIPSGALQQNLRHTAHHPQAPAWIAYVMATMFGVPGLFLIGHGIRGVVRKAVWRREFAARPHEPWLSDHHWNRDGIAFSAFDDMVKRLFAALVWTAFLLPFGWIGVTQRGAWPFLAAVAIFGLLGLIFWYRWAQMLFDFLRYGNSYFTYDEFPFALGGTVRGRLRVPRHIQSIDELTLTLRCVQEQYVTTGTGENRTSKVVGYQLYGESLTLNRDRLNGLIAGEIPVEFKVPAGQPTTTLIATPPTYWELEAKGRSQTGANYEAVFLVPVYKNS
jgi:hypothetical protein